MREDMPIGFFDSGVGGLNVLAAARKQMPEENCIYFGDSLNAPYGTKTDEEIRRLVWAGVDCLLYRGIKALVVACNTATGVAVDDLRARLDIPVISMEPAIKPALEQTGGTVLLMATDATIHSARVQALIDRYDEDKRVIGVPCRLLAKKIEDAVFASSDLDAYLAQTLSPFAAENVTAIVLGCTHYPFVRERILKALGKPAAVFDGIDGTVRHLQSVRNERHLLRPPRGESGTCEILSSRGDETTITLYQRLLTGGTL